MKYKISLILAGCLITCTLTSNEVSHDYQTFLYIPSITELKNYFFDCWNILKAMFTDQEHTAACSASSPWLVHHITKYIPRNKPINLLEVGPGPGTITQKVIERMHPQTTLDAVEYNTDLYQKLTKRFSGKQSTHITLYHAPIETWEPTHTTNGYYDTIISTIPTTQLPLDTMKKIISRYTHMLRPGGFFIHVNLCGSTTLTLWTKKIRHTWYNFLNSYVTTIDKKDLTAYADDLDQYQKIIKVLNDWKNNNFTEIETQLVMLNIPPSYMMCLQKHIE